MHWSSTPRSGVGWLILDRVIDGPAWQGVLTWDGSGWAFTSDSNWRCWPDSKSGTLWVPAMRNGADYLLIAKPVAFNQLGIRCDCAKFVQTEPVVSSSLWRPRSRLLLATTRNVSEICETGEQGGLTDGLEMLVLSRGMLSTLQLNLSTQIDELPTEKADSFCDYRALHTQVCKDGK